MSACARGNITFELAWFESLAAAIHNGYADIHPYITVMLCVAGTLMNVSTVIVLTRPSMISAVNLLLCAVAVCDVVVMMSYSFFASHFLLTAQRRCEPADFSQLWGYFLYLHSQFTVILHATSIWLTVILAQIRVLTIRKARIGPTEAIGVRATMLISLLSLFVCTVLNMPNMVTFEITSGPAAQNLPCLLYDEEAFADFNETRVVDLAQLVYNVVPDENDCSLLTLAYWTNGILFKVVPCILLTVSIVALLRIIADVATRRKNLAQVMNKKRMPRDHTTPMLVAVLSIFLVAELPQGLLHVANAVFNESFYHKIYSKLGDVMDLLSLINSAVNFIIYCAMSRKFRSVFLNLFLGCLPDKMASRWRDEWENGDVSRPRPSGYTNTEQRAAKTMTSVVSHLALTSSTHRPSATSLLLRSSSRENLPKMYSGNLLTAGEQSGRSSPSPPFLALPAGASTRESDCRRVSSDVVEITLTVPSVKHKRQKARLKPMQALRKLLEPATEAGSSPQRRANILKFETSSVY